MQWLDEAILHALAKSRSPWLNRAMADITSLGSPTVIILISVAAFSLLWIAQNRRGAARVVTAAAGAEIWLEIIKRVFERPRPTLVPYMVEFTGFSFPSGHALVATAVYGTLAAVACSYLQQRRARIAIRLYAGQLSQSSPFPGSIWASTTPLMLRAACYLEWPGSI
jgi:membrane-associated phospholipid phosphatase